MHSRIVIRHHWCLLLLDADPAPINAVRMHFGIVASHLDLLLALALQLLLLLVAILFLQHGLLSVEASVDSFVAVRLNRRHPLSNLILKAVHFFSGQGFQGSIRAE